MNEDVIVVECPSCGQKSEYAIISAIDSVANPYDKHRLLNGTLFDCKCGNCNFERDLAYDMVYKDGDTVIYLVNDGDAQGVYTALRLTDALNGDNKDKTRKRIVTCPHRLKEKALIFDLGLDDRIIELAKIFCLGDAEENMPDQTFIDATFNIKDGQHVIELLTEEKTITAIIPEGFLDHLAMEFADVLENDNGYVINDLWAMDVIGIDPYNEMDDECECGCDGDCDHCHHDCNGDDYDDCDDYDDDYYGECGQCPCDDCTNDCEHCIHNQEDDLSDEDDWDDEEYEEDDDQENDEDSEEDEE